MHHAHSLPYLTLPPPNLALRDYGLILATSTPSEYATTFRTPSRYSFEMGVTMAIPPPKDWVISTSLQFNGREV